MIHEHERTIFPFRRAIWLSKIPQSWFTHYVFWYYPLRSTCYSKGLSLFFIWLQLLTGSIEQLSCWRNLVKSKILELSALQFIVSYSIRIVVRAQTWGCELNSAQWETTVVSVRKVTGNRLMQFATVKEILSPGSVFCHPGIRVCYAVCVW